MFKLKLKRLFMKMLRSLKVVRVTKLVDKSLTSFRFLHDSFLVILTKGSGEFVVVHGWTILSFAPQSSNFD